MAFMVWPMVKQGHSKAIWGLNHVWFVMVVAWAFFPLVICLEWGLIAPEGQDIKSI